MVSIEQSIETVSYTHLDVYKRQLVHKSQMSNKFVKDPMEIVSVGDVIDVKVIGIDLDKGRVSLSMKL